MTTTVGPDKVPTSPIHKGEVPFYRERGQAQPRAVKGRFRDIKWWAMAILLAWWHLAPFLRWDRGPGAPDQAILIDMPGRRAYFFFIEIWPQEVYYLTGLLLIAAISLFLMSALAGRVWCGFLCWQTVYTDLFQQVERVVLGDRNTRIALGRQPFSIGKALRQGLVYALWLVIAAACGIGFTLWFGDAFQNLRDIFTLQASPATYLFIAVIGGFCFLLAGFARERVCVYMCPYSRFQSAMLDEHSLIVSYEAWRGEPRAVAPKDLNFTGRGHCVDCKMCVQSCPTGVDIRFGNQLACIGCGLCIDACDTVMEKFKLPKGLIRLDSSANLEARTSGQPAPGRRIVRPRTMLYTALLAIVGTVILISLITRATTEVNVLHERSPLFVQMSDGGIRNGYAYKILNMIREDRTYSLTTQGVDGARIDVIGGDSGVPQTELSVDKDSVGTFRLFVTAPDGALKGARQPITFILTEKGTGKTVRSESMFAAPDR
ncbi:MAG TPA: cytochrome c oxidase accessory protein CcoG [Magnetospirillum sp.]|nr:cytochrome c oxidase accessory protein CcoG [Magnetospirillum sp.]